MSIKVVVCLLVISSLVANCHRIDGLDELDPEKSDRQNEIIDDDISLNSQPTSTITTTTLSSTSSPLTTPRTTRNIKICTDLTPDFISNRNGGYQTLQCSVKICDDMDYISDTDVHFNQPLFDWNSGLGHILLSNGTCDYEKGHCWHSIDIDVRYFSHQMLDNGVTELQFSCAVSDSFVDLNGNAIGWGFGSDFNSLKYFRGLAIDQICDNDLQCGDNMFCLNSGRSEDTVCQCSVDFLTGVQFVQVLDQKYNEMQCLPPLMINDSCLHDQQCQAMDPNSVCVQTITPDSQMSGRCQCSQGMVFSKSSCIPISLHVTPKPTIVWWIFSDTDAYGETSSHRFRWFRAALYLVAFLAIGLPISFVFISLCVLCYNRMLKNRAIARQSPIRPTFPAPKIIINDLIRKEKSDDKYGLVKHDQLAI